MTTTVTVTDARASLPQILDLVKQGQEVTLTRHGEPVAVIMRPDTVRARRTDETFAMAAGVHELIEQGARSPLPEHGGISEARAEELIAYVRDSRSSR